METSFRHLRLDALAEPPLESFRVVAHRKCRELVAAQAVDAVLGAYSRTKRCSDRLEHLIANRMAKRVIDRLEAINVNHRKQESQGPTVDERGRHIVVEGTPVAEAGEGSVSVQFLMWPLVGGPAVSAMSCGASNEGCG